MKNTIRVRKDGATKPTALQTKIKLSPEFKLPADAPHAACLAIFNREDGAMFRIPVSEKEFDDIWRQSIKPGALPLKEFIASAIREKISRGENWEADQAFEAAALKAIGLIDLLFSKLIADDPDCYNAALVNYNAEKTQIIRGIQEFVIEVKNGLTAGLCEDSKKGSEVAS